MKKFVQDQKSFFLGEVSSANLSKLGENYFSSLTKCENYVVNRDGSITPRKGVSPVLSFEKTGKDSDISEFDEYVLYQGTHFFRKAEEVYFLKNSSKGFIKQTISFDFSKMLGYATLEGVSNIEASLPDIFNNLETPEPFKMKEIKGVLYVYMRRGTPFKIFKYAENYMVVCPFHKENVFSQEFENLADKFPFSSLDGKISYGDILYKKLSDGSFIPAVSEGIEPQFCVANEETLEDTGGKNVCYIDTGHKAESLNLGDEFYVDIFKAGLADKIGKPFLISIGPKNINQPALRYTPSPVPQGFTPTVLNGFLANVAKNVYPTESDGSTDYNNWDENKASTEVLADSKLINPLFLALKTQFFLVIPKNYVTLSSTVSVEADRFVKAKDFYKEVQKSKYGLTGGTGYSECYIEPLGVYHKGKTLNKNYMNNGSFQDASSKSAIEITYTPDFYESDWNNDPPIDGGFVQGKVFHFTQRGKVTFSNFNSSQNYSKPFKFLNLLSKSRFKYANRIYRLPTFEDVLDGKLDYSKTLLDFFQALSFNEESLTFNIKDGISYFMRSSEFDKVTPTAFVDIAVGSLSAQNLQVVTATSVGIFYWGFAQAQSILQGFNLNKVSNFRINPSAGIIQVNNAVYFTGEEGRTLYYVKFSELSRSFNLQVAIQSYTFGKILKILNFEEDRVLVLSQNSLGVKKVHVLNVNTEGDLSGTCEWTFSRFRVEDAYTFKNVVYFKLSTDESMHIYEYSKSDFDMDIDSKTRLSTYAQVELPPVTMSRHWPMHGLSTARQIKSLVLFSEDVKSVDLNVEGSWKNLNEVNLQSKILDIDLKRAHNVGTFLKANTNSKSVGFRQKVGDLGSIGGLSMELKAGEIDG